MPAIQAFLELAARSATDTASPNPLQVVCAFPVSGQYGAGSRIVSFSTSNVAYQSAHMFHSSTTFL